MKNGETQVLRSCAAIALVFGLGSLAARADSFYNSETAWTAALSGSPTTINFEGIVPPNSSYFFGSGPGASIVVGGVTFAIGPSDPFAALLVFGDNFYSYPVASLSDQSNSSTGPPVELLITLPSSVTALGFDFGGLKAAGIATITLSDGSVETAGAPVPPGLAFFGVTGSAGITSVKITLPVSTMGFDMTDFSYVPATSPVPEPSGLLLIGTGLAALVRMARRKIAPAHLAS
jgi:hypothetical protein